MSKTLLPVAFFLVLINLSAAARILCIFPAPMYSHQSFFRPIWEELSKRGHDVTVITPDPQRDLNCPNLRQIDLSFSHKLVHADLATEEMVSSTSNLLVLLLHYVNTVNNMTSEQMHYRGVQDLARSGAKFDLVIAEAHFPAWFAFAKKFSCPLIVATSMKPTAYMHRLLGNIHSAALSPDVNVPFPQEHLSFFQRVMARVCDHVMNFITFYMIYPRHQKLAREVLDDAAIDLLGIVKNVTLLIANVVPGITRPVPTVPSIVNGNGLHIQPPKKLPEDLQKFLDDAAQGVIYFSLGSSVKSHLMTGIVRNVFFNVFRSLPMKVIWKYEDPNFTMNHENIKIIKWAPQQDVLRHKNVKLFITQGGIQSIEESIRFQVPIVGIPFVGDQFSNVFRLEHLKMGRSLNINDITEENVRNLILETASNKEYRKNLEELSELMQDPKESRHKVIWWIESVIKHRGSEHIKGRLRDMPLYQYYLLDVGLFVIIIVALVGFVIRKFFQLVRQTCCNVVVKIKKD